MVMKYDLKEIKLASRRAAYEEMIALVMHDDRIVLTMPPSGHVSPDVDFTWTLANGVKLGTATMIDAAVIEAISFFDLDETGKPEKPKRWYQKFPWNSLPQFWGLGLTILAAGWAAGLYAGIAVAHMAPP